MLGLRNREGQTDQMQQTPSTSQEGGVAAPCAQTIESMGAAISRTIEVALQKAQHPKIFKDSISNSEV